MASSLKFSRVITKQVTNGKQNNFYLNCAHKYHTKNSIFSSNSPLQSINSFFSQNRVNSPLSIQKRNIKINIIPPPDMQPVKKKREKKDKGKEKLNVDFHPQSQEEKEDANSDNWFIFASALLERIPIIYPLPPSEVWYNDYQKMIDETPDLEVPYSPEEIVAKIKQEKDSAKKSKKKKGAAIGDININEARILDFLTLKYTKPQIISTDALSDFEEVDNEGKVIREWAMRYFNRKTEYENSNFTCFRKLDERLYLIVKKPIEKDPWLFPLDMWTPGESMTQSVERSLIQNVGSKADFKVISTAPEGYFCHHFDESLQEKTKKKGFKVFYYRALYYGNGKDLDFTKSDVTDYAWVSREELKDYVPELQYRLFSHMLYKH